MTWRYAISLTALALLLGGCSPGWTQTGPGGEPYAHAQTVCRAKAHDSAVRQVTLDQRNADRGMAGADDRAMRDIEARETALCLQQRGFRMTWGGGS